LRFISTNPYTLKNKIHLIMARFSSADVLTAMITYPLVPVFYHADINHAQRVLAACYAGGVRVFEFTNRGANALDVFTSLQPFAQANCPEMVLGIGTIFGAQDAEKFIDAGAEFVVQPVTTPEVGDVCQRRGIVWVPGATTVNEIFRATQLGADIVKIFPGNVVGSGFVKALRGPMPNVKIMVTGGVEPTVESLTEWFGAGVNGVGIGSQLFRGADDPAVLTARIDALMPFITTLLNS
jgi:2-dehydro-3-deoxyphosphogluconate aldolase/(4S)-4-hydroxy-2-oxoglutarate aldolase